MKEKVMNPKVEAALNFLDTFYELPDACKNYLRNKIQIRKVKKGEVILRAGQVNTQMFFIVSGGIHCFYNVNEKPVSAWFFFEREFVVSIGSFYKQLASEDYLVAMEDGELLYITHEDYSYLKTTYPDFRGTALELMEYYLQIFSEHPRFIRKHTAAERYQLILEKRPDLVARVPVNALASWLGMDPDTLSRMRGQ